VDGCRPAGRFSKQQRVTRRREFREAQAESRRVVTRHFVLLLRARPLPDAPIPDTGIDLGARVARLGITASRKVGNAVLRNRAKRLVREAFRATRELWADGLDIIVIVKHFDSEQKLAHVTNEWLEARGRIRRSSVDALARKPKLHVPLETEKA
jgi:ribonuclease P protein component